MTAETIVVSRSGHESLKANGIHVNSPYDPLSEAKRFFDSLPMHGNPSLFVFLEPGVPYLAHVAETSFPGSRKIVIHYGEICLSIPSPFSTYPSIETETLEEFLAREIREEDIEGIAVVEWRQGESAYPGKSESVRKALTDHVRAMTSSLQTTGSRGLLCLKNQVKNLLFMKNLAFPTKTPGPIVVAASGPSLELALGALAERRNRFTLFALSSAVPALEASGLHPDLVFSSDPGRWAAYLLEGTYRGKLPVAFIVSANLPSSMLDSNPLVPVSGGGALETSILQEAGMPFIPGISEGTVLGTATALARKLTEGPVILAGADFASLDIKAHAIPHGFHDLFAYRSSRIMPLYSALFSRETEEHHGRIDGTWRTSPRLAAYAAWTSREKSPTGGGKCLRLNPSPVKIPSMEDLDEAGFSRLLGSSPLPAFSIVQYDHPPSVRIHEAIVSVFRRCMAEIAEGSLTGNFSEPTRDLFMMVDCPGFLTLRKLERSERNSEANSLRIRTNEKMGTVLRLLCKDHDRDE